MTDGTKGVTATTICRDDILSAIDRMAGVRLGKWERAILHGEAPNPHGRSQRTAWKRAADRLQELGLVRTELKCSKVPARSPRSNYFSPNRSPWVEMRDDGWYCERGYWSVCAGRTELGEYIRDVLGDDLEGTHRRIRWPRVRRRLDGAEGEKLLAGTRRRLTELEEQRRERAAGRHEAMRRAEAVLAAFVRGK